MNCILCVELDKGHAKRVDQLGVTSKMYAVGKINKTHTYLTDSLVPLHRAKGGGEILVKLSGDCEWS